MGFKEAWKAQQARSDAMGAKFKARADNLVELQHPGFVDKKKELDEQNIAYCPKCLSTSLTANKKGFGLGKALVGGILTGGVGLLAGNIGKNKVLVTCMKCGNQFKT